MLVVTKEVKKSAGTEGEGLAARRELVHDTVAYWSPACLVHSLGLQAHQRSRLAYSIKRIMQSTEMIG